MPLGPGYLVTAPAPSPPRYTLLNAVTVIDEADDHWMLGAQALNYPCGLPQPYDGLNQTAQSKPTAASFANNDYDVITLTYTVSCTSRGLVFDEFLQRAQTAFQARESAGLERAFWLGLKDETPTNLDTPFIADTDATVLNSGTKTSVANALALLEDSIAAEGQAGMIHMPAALAAVGGFNLNQEGSGTNARLVTKLGTVVVPGAGYPGTGKDVTAITGTSQWAFATGAIEVRRSPLLSTPTDPREALNRSTNTYTVTLERMYLVTWDTCIHSAVLVDRCQATC